MEVSRDPLDSASSSAAIVNHQSVGAGAGDIGRLIRSVRESKGLSLRALARQLSVSPATMSQLETGKTRVSALRLVRIAEVLGVGVQDLFGPTTPGAPVDEQSAGAGQPHKGLGVPANRHPADVVARAVDSGRGPWRVFPELDLDPVLRAALHAFHRTGYHGSSMRDIAAAAGLSVPGLYHHYVSKQAMLGALIEIAGTESLWRAQVAREEGVDGVQRFTNVVESIVLFNTHRQALASVAYAELRNLDRENRARIRAVRARIQKLIDTEIAAGIAAGEFDPIEAKEAGRAVVMLCTSLANWFRVGGALSAEQVGTLYARFALDMMRARRTGR
jgi:AcrR family transcriptional regulator/transcriptional regulator with XRE-family HTH domain